MDMRIANIKKVLQLDGSSKLKLPIYAFECRDKV
jgi:hypothetical protein